MIKIKEFKISLMEKDLQSNTELEENKNNFIIRSSASFNVDKYVKDLNQKLEGEDYENFLSTSSRLIYNELLSTSSHKSVVDTVGIWITTDSSTYENSMDIDTLDKMEQYGQEDLNGIFELIKMTIHN